VGTDSFILRGGPTACHMLPLGVSHTRPAFITFWIRHWPGVARCTQQCKLISSGCLASVGVSCAGDVRPTPSHTHRARIRRYYLPSCEVAKSSALFCAAVGQRWIRRVCLSVSFPQSIVITLFSSFPADFPRWPRAKPDFPTHRSPHATAFGVVLYLVLKTQVQVSK